MQAWFYDLEGSGGQLLAEHDYLGSVEAMHLNADWAAALFEGICCACDVHWKQAFSSIGQLCPMLGNLVFIGRRTAL